MDKEIWSRDKEYLINRILRLERRIHNQRVALRQDWSIRRSRGSYVGEWRIWMHYAMKQGKELRALKEKLRHLGKP